MPEERDIDDVMAEEKSRGSRRKRLDRTEIEKQRETRSDLARVLRAGDERGILGDYAPARAERRLSRVCPCFEGVSRTVRRARLAIRWISALFASASAGGNDASLPSTTAQMTSRDFVRGPRFFPAMRTLLKQDCRMRLDAASRLSAERTHADHPQDANPRSL